MPRFLHTSDWQLGMTRRFLNPDAQARYSQARLDAVKRIAALAEAERCICVVVAGDIFEFERMDRATVAKTLETMRDAAVPFLLLPGNHDPHHDDSVYASGQFRRNCPRNVVVLADAAPVRVADDLEIVGAPWHSKHPVGNPVIKTVADLPPAPAGVHRVCLAHGPADIRAHADGAEAPIPVDFLEKAVTDGKIHFAALGDRHSTDTLDAAGRIRYSGTPEATDFDEVKPGYVQVIDLSPDAVAVHEHKIGVWTFTKLERELVGPDDVDTLLRDLRGLPEKSATVLRLDLAGSLGLADDERLRGGLDDLALLFAGLDIRDGGYAANAADSDTLCAHLSGYAGDAAQTLRDTAAGGGPDAGTARDALLLLGRLAPADAEGTPL
jgi:DNA repair exonuclease SbcCD nuclease subunit